MRFWAPLFLIPLLASCGQRSTVDSVFQPYVDGFVKEAKAHGKEPDVKDISIHFGETATGAAAHCVLNRARPGMGGNEIVVDAKFWNSMTDYYSVEREIIIYHELGHCALGLEHQNGSINICDASNRQRVSWYKEVPLSIMKSDSFVDPNLYNNMRTYYMDQLFTGKARIAESTDETTPSSSSRSTRASIRREARQENCRALEDLLDI